MIAEKLIDNQPMILGAPEKRSYYETAALIVALWADNLEALTDKLITDFHSLSKEDKIAKLMQNPLYFNRFGGYSITRLATEVSNAPGWKWLEWLGHFNDSNFPWIYHDGLGWLYVYGPTDDQVWFYLPSAGWLWTSKNIWQTMSSDSTFLWLYDQANTKWVFLILNETLPINPDDLESPSFKEYPSLPLDSDKNFKRTFWDSKLLKFFLYE
jgi:hypothetical protein